MKRRRTGRPPGIRASRRAWSKPTHQPVTATGWSNDVGDGMPWVPLEKRLNTYRRCAATGDAVAVVEAVRHCQENGVPIPDWVVGELSQLLLEFIALATSRGRRLVVRPPRYLPWGKEYLRAFQDWLVTEAVESYRRVYGMTWPEAIDAQVWHARGTLLAATPDQVKKAIRRARARAKNGWFKRLPGVIESDTLGPIFDPPVIGDSPRSWWWLINSERVGDQRGEWRKRPRLLATLSSKELEAAVRQARKRIERTFSASGRTAT